MDATLKPAPPVSKPLATTAFQTPGEARTGLRTGARLAASQRKDAAAFALWAHNWLQRRGAEVLGPDLPVPSPPPGVRVQPMDPADRAVRHAADVCGISERHFYRMAALGTVRAQLTNLSLPADHLSDHALAALTELLPAGKGGGNRVGKPELIGEIVRQAIQKSTDENVPITAKMIKALIDKALKRVPPTPPTAEQQAVAVLRKLIAKAVKNTDWAGAEYHMREAARLLEEL